MPRACRLSRPTEPIRGVGLFSAIPSSLMFIPADALSVVRLRHGHAMAGTPVSVAFISNDTAWAGLPHGAPIRNTTLCGPVGEASASTIATIEHALAACAGLGLWHAALALDGGPEVPIMDGSAAPFVKALRPGLEAAASLSPIRLAEPVEVRRGDDMIRAEPFEGIDFTYELDYGPTAPLPPQQASWLGDPDDFAANIAPARTFSLLHEARAAHAAGLFRHLTPRDMLVVGDDGRPVDNAWRFENEPARHKLLDLIGDLALLGRPLHARIVARRAGHALTHDLCRRILAQQRTPRLN
ncbi:MAG: UDP-3-O-acyl-N-acetylglucosamine deacetylase [Phycisphaerae bacterium]|nr:MAG: UDP-3-O-acyl-N-acetylglucosamine deacetylase [Phycisphaerae bacterium]